MQVKRRLMAPEDCDPQVENYDFNNSNDRDNFCPAVQVGGVLVLSLR
jgi:hypothetical protein